MHTLIKYISFGDLNTEITTTLLPREKQHKYSINIK
jgi:hypothetical protein